MAEQPEGQACKNCRYALKPISSNDPNHFACRRNPPVRLRTESSDGYVIVVSGSFWCGEFVPANPETIEDGAVVLARLVLIGDKAAAYALADKLKAREACSFP